MMGHSVKVLLDDHKAAGYHSLEFDATNLASGVYLYSIQAGDFIRTKKMLFIK